MTTDEAPDESDTRDLFDGVTTDLTPSERVALVYIRHNGPIRQQELHEDRVVSVGASKHAGDGLADKGLIERQVPRRGPGGSPWMYDPDWHDRPFDKLIP